MNFLDGGTAGRIISHEALGNQFEHWIVGSVAAQLSCGDEVFILSESQSAYILLGTRHRVENPGTIPLEIIEVQLGSYLGEDDIVWFEDVYDRVTG